jgi:5'-nucleotidase
MARTHDKVLGVDVDNVLANYTEGLRRIVSEELGVLPATLPDPSAWNYIEWGISDEEFNDVHRRAVVEHRMFRDLEVMPGAAEVLQELSDQGVRIRIVTHRLYLSGTHEVVAHDTVEWLEKHDIPYWDLCMVAKKGDVGCDLYIDDAPHNIQALRDIGRKVIVYDWPYNRELEGPRARSWEDIRELTDPMLLAVEKLFDL